MRQSASMIELYRDWDISRNQIGISQKWWCLIKDHFILDNYWQAHMTQYFISYLALLPLLTRHRCWDFSIDNDDLFWGPYLYRNGRVNATHSVLAAHGMVEFKGINQSVPITRTSLTYVTFRKVLPFAIRYGVIHLLEEMASIMTHTAPAELLVSANARQWAGLVLREILICFLHSSVGHQWAWVSFYWSNDDIQNGWSPVVPWIIHNLHSQTSDYNPTCLLCFVLV